MIIDPLDESRALDSEDGELMSAVRMLPIEEGKEPPTIEELANAPIFGYARPDSFIFDPLDPQ
jgi:hypothetical protein